MTNLDREGLDDQDQDHDGYSQVQEFVNEAPDLDLPEDDGMIGFDDFQDDFKNPELDQTAGNQLGEDMFNDFNSEREGSASIRALTIKDGVNYEDAAYDELAAAQVRYELDNQMDTIQNAGQDFEDNMARDEKVNQIQDKIHDDMEDQVKQDYLKIFRKEVDFHHKVAYRFEKAYRLGKKMSVKKAALNNEITNIIVEHDSYIEQDPMALFYCLYFCIYYNNPEIVEFLKLLVGKMQNLPEKIDELLKSVIQNGIGRLRMIGDPLNQHVYHMVFYQAIDDELRIVYSQILRQLKFVQLRDKDAEHFLKQRDYELIRLTFEKFTIKINSKAFFKQEILFKSHNYRQYN